MRRLIATLALAAAALIALPAPVLAFEGPTGTVTVTKQIVSDGEDSGPLSPGDFQLFVGETPVTSGVPTVMPTGTYSVIENNEPNYILIGFSGACGGDADGRVTISDEGSTNCTIINQYQRPQAPPTGTVTIHKTVDNELGGEASADDFTFQVGQQTVILNEPTSFDVGDYRVTESGPSHYVASYSENCAGGRFTIEAESNTDCDIINTYVPPRETPPHGGGGNTPPPNLSIVTSVTNDDVGTKGPADFTASVANGSATLSVTGAGASGSSVLLTPGSYLVTPAADLGYGSTLSAGCAGSLTDGQTAVCTIAYNDLPLTIAPPPEEPPVPPTFEPEPPVDVTPTDDGTSTPPIEVPTPPSNPAPFVPPPTPPRPFVLGATDVSGAQLDVSATAPDLSPAPEPTPPVTLTASSGARCVWFWGWFGCYWWILLLIAILLICWRAWRAWVRSKKPQP